MIQCKDQEQEFFLYWLLFNKSKKSFNEKMKSVILEICEFEKQK